MFSSNPKELIKIFKMNRYYLILLYGLLGACLFSVSLQAAAPVLELEAGQKNYNLNSTLEVLEDPSRELSFQQIQLKHLRSASFQFQKAATVSAILSLRSGYVYG